MHHASTRDHVLTDKNDCTPASIIPRNWIQITQTVEGSYQASLPI